MLVEYATSFIVLYTTIFYLLLFASSRKIFHSEPRQLSENQLPKVSIVIPVYNEENVIAKTLRSVLALDYPRNKLEIIVVDDESTDKSAEIISKFKGAGGVKLIKNKHRGIGKSSALNAGIRSASGELIATVDADSFPARNALRKLAAYFVDKSTVAVTAAIKVHEPRNLWEKIQSIEYLSAILQRRLLSILDSVNVTPGPMSLFRASVFDKIGLFDENSLGEDQEMAYRIQSHHYRIVSSTNAEVSTVVPRKFTDLLRQRVRWYRGGIQNYIKHSKLLGPKYGDLGTFVIPVGIFSVILVIALFASFLFDIFMKPLDLSLEGLTYSFGPLQIISIAIIILVLALLVVIRTVLGDKTSLSLPRIIVFLAIYSYLMAIFWLAAIAEEVTQRKRRW